MDLSQLTAQSRRRRQTSPAQQLYRPSIAASPVTRPDIHQQAVQANPLFGRPPYAQVAAQGVLGPVPAGNYRGGVTWMPPRQLGTGRTGALSKPGEANVLPGFMAERKDYQPTTMEYAPDLRVSWMNKIPATLATPGTMDGIALLGTYRAHDFTAGRGDTRFIHQMRSAPNWQVMSFPPDFRKILQWQQVMRYQVMSQTRAARPLRQTDYFLGYVTQPSVAAQIGGNTLGYMGSQ